MALILTVALGVLVIWSFGTIGFPPIIPFSVSIAAFLVGAVAGAEGRARAGTLVLVLAGFEVAWAVGLWDYKTAKNTDKPLDFAATVSLLYAEPYKLFTKEAANKHGHYKGEPEKYIHGDASFDWGAVFAENDGVTIGENHTTTSAIDFLVSNLPAMKANGLNVVFTELTPVSWAYLKNFNPPEGVGARILTRRRDDGARARLEKACSEAGVPLLPFDIDPEHSPASAEGMVERNRAMAQAVAKLENFLWEDAGRRLKFVTLNGARHIKRGTMDPPESLNDFLACYGIRTLAVDIESVFKFS